MRSLHTDSDMKYFIYPSLYPIIRYIRVRYAEVLLYVWKQRRIHLLDLWPECVRINITVSLTVKPDYAEVTTNTQIFASLLADICEKDF